MGEFPSGQRGQTVNLLSLTSVVRIHLPPPRRSKLYIACSDLFYKSERAHAAAPPLRKRSRSARLLGCKRPRNGLLSLPTFCGLREFNPHQQNTKNIFFMRLRHTCGEQFALRSFFFFAAIRPHLEEQSSLLPEVHLRHNSTERLLYKLMPNTIIVL